MSRGPNKGTTTNKNREKLFFLGFLVFFHSSFVGFSMEFAREGFPNIPAKYSRNPPKSKDFGGFGGYLEGIWGNPSLIKFGGKKH